MTQRSQRPGDSFVCAAGASKAEEPCEGVGYRNLTWRHKALLVIGAIVGMVGGTVVFLSSLGIFLKPMSASFDWGRADVSLLPAAFLVGVAIGAPCLGYVADRIGWKRVIAISIALYSFGMLVMSMVPASRPWVILLCFSIGLAGASTNASGYLPLVSSAFERNLGAALGFVMFGSSLCAAVVPVLAGKLLELMEWRQAYVLFAVLCLLLGFLAHWIIFRVVRDRGRAPGHRIDKRTAKTLHSGEGVSFAQAVRGYRFWLLVIVVVLATGAVTGAGIHLFSYLTDRGISLALAAQSVALLGFSGVVARVGAGLLLDRLFAPFFACAAFVLNAVGFYLLSTDMLEAGWVLPLSVILIGLAAGGEGDIFPFVVKKYFGMRAFGSIFGVLFSCALLSGALSAYVYGWSFDIWNSYVPILQIGAVLCCVSGLAMLALGRYRY